MKGSGIFWPNLHLPAKTLITKDVGHDEAAWEGKVLRNLASLLASCMMVNVYQFAGTSWHIYQRAASLHSPVILFPARKTCTPLVFHDLELSHFSIPFQRFSWRCESGWKLGNHSEQWGQVEGDTHAYDKSVSSFIAPPLTLVRPFDSLSMKWGEGSHCSDGEIGRVIHQKQIFGCFHSHSIVRFMSQCSVLLMHCQVSGRQTRRDPKASLAIRLVRFLELCPSLLPRDSYFVLWSIHMAKENSG